MNTETRAQPLEDNSKAKPNEDVEGQQKTLDIRDSPPNEKNQYGGDEDDRTNKTQNRGEFKCITSSVVGNNNNTEWKPGQFYSDLQGGSSLWPPFSSLYESAYNAHSNGSFNAWPRGGTASSLPGYDFMFGASGATGHSHHGHQNPNSLYQYYPGGAYARSTSSVMSRESSRDDLTSMGDGQIFEYEERFRVDRRKLELLITGNFEPIKEPAVDFFSRIGEETGTTVIWPSRLKVGAKSKKDPHIRIGGPEAAVRTAKSKIMEYLDTRSNRVTMKMDVSYTDHSHVIGKGGNTIRRVMAETNCHIHFPDSNRNNPHEKSNQVSIAGEIRGVEVARARIRELTPLIFCFDLPIIPSLQNSPDVNEPYIRAIQDQYNVQVTFRQKQKNFHTTMVVIKGSECEAARVKEATLLLMEHLCGNLPASAMSIVSCFPGLLNPMQMVSMNMEITPLHHQIVLGKGNITLKLIMQRTNTTILFPDASDPNIPSIRRGSVTITGSIHNVYLARQQLIGSLPLVMMFDINDESEIDESLIQSLQTDLDLSILIKPKARQGNKSVIIKAQERNASAIYKARAALLRLDEKPVEASIPESYNILPISQGGSALPVNHRAFAPNVNDLSSSRSGRPSTSSNLGGQNSNLTKFPAFQSHLPPPPLPLSPNVSPTSTSAPPLTPFAGVFSKPSTPSPGSLPGTYPWSLANVFPPNHPVLQDYAMMVLSNITRMQEQNRNANANGNPTEGKVIVGDDGAKISKNNHGLLSGDISSPPIPGTSPRNSSPVHEDGNNLTKEFETTKFTWNESSHETPTDSSRNSNNVSNNNNQSDFSLLGDRRAPGCEKELMLKSGTQDALDYEQKRVLARKAMHQKPRFEIPRKPDPTWSGMGFSCSMPGALIKQELDDTEERLKNIRLEDSIVKEPLLEETEVSLSKYNRDTYPSNGNPSIGGNNRLFFGNSSAFDSILNQDNRKTDLDRMIRPTDDLQSVFDREGLSKYVDLFLRQEIDLRTFATLTDDDLKEIGVQTFGARKKLLLLAIRTKQALEQNW